jgi:hypothetical protein
MAKLEPFVHAVEVWVPDGAALRRHSGAYGPHRELEEVGRTLSFAPGVGLPGEALRTRAPVVWSELDTRFARHEQAARAGIAAALAFPLLRGEQLIAVVVLLCGSRERTGGCLEVWQPNDVRELALVDGYYGRLEAFAELSRLIRFQRGRGLPGLAWERGAPVIMTDLANSNSFIRASAARTSGVHAGLALPLFQGVDIRHILVLLSAHDTPLARAFEVWSVLPGGALSLSEWFYASDVTTTPGRPDVAPGYALARQVTELRLPIASESASGARNSFALGLGIPVFQGSTLRAIVILLS